jgi:hypothetical protein
MMATMKRKRPHAIVEFRNLRVLPSGYQVVVTRRQREYGKHFAGHSPQSLRAAIRYRDQLLRVLPNKRKNLIPRRLLTALGLKKPIVGVSRHPNRRLFQVSYRSANGRLHSRSFSWADLAGEIKAYAAAVRFRKHLLGQNRIKIKN